MEEQPKTPKPIPWRLILFLVVAVLLIGIIWYAYYWFTTTQKTLALAKTVITQANQYEVLSEKMENEYQRCQQFIAQEQGEFGQFEYCKRFINWVNANSTE